MIPYLVLVAFLSLLSVQKITSLWSDLEMKSLESLNGTDSFPIAYDMKLKRIRRGAYGISGSILMTDTLDDYTCEVLIFHSPTRNNMYKLLPFNIPEGPMCPKVEKEYRQLLMKDLHKISDLPYSEDESDILCPLFAKDKTFTFTHYEFDKSVIPKFALTGMYRVQYVAKKDNIVMSGVEIIVDLS